MRTRSNSVVRLDWYHRLVTRTILDYQDPVTGLLPPKTPWNSSKCQPGGYPEDGWVRDNVYTIMAVWGLALAYRKNADLDEDRAKTYELEQSVVKLMRGLLSCMIRQVHKVESFKKTQAPEDSLHAKYNLKTGKTVVADRLWGHLQIDATSIFLLTLAQMTASGIRIIFTLDEVAFIQNLVFYIEEAYRIPDYGMWERGDKLNHGNPELNASSIGAAKAALEAMNGLDLFGSEGGQSSVIHVLPDNIQSCKAILQSMLPKESNSKEIAASLLSVISFPAFAVEDEELVNITMNQIVEQLQGRYGLCRFLRDGYKTPLEDQFRLHYEPAELKIFENIECEWPIFFTYLLLDGLFLDKEEQVKTYTKLLDAVVVKDENGLPLVPELYYVPKDKVGQEKQQPHSVERTCGTFVPHMWGQSLYILACLLQEKFIAVGEIDPLNRRHSTIKRPDVVVQVALLAEDESIRQLLREMEVPVQTKDEVQPIEVLPASELRKAYQYLGKNTKLKLTGRPHNDIGVLGTSMLYRVGNSIKAFTPQFTDYQQFFLSLDGEFLADSIKSFLGYLGNNWRMLGRPIFTCIITDTMLEGSTTSSIAKLIKKLKGGYIYGVRVRLGHLSDFLSTSCITTLSFVKEDDEIGMEIRNISQDLLKEPAHREHRKSPSTWQSPIPGTGGRMSVHGMVRRSRSISVYSKDSLKSPSVDDESSANAWTPQRSRKMSMDVDTYEYIQQLEVTESIHDQADILHFLHNNKGPDFDTNLHGSPGTTVHKLLEELFEKACQVKLWSLVRHTAGLLKKRVGDITGSLTDLLVRGKQVTIGIPQQGREEVLDRPYPPREFKNMIFGVYGEDIGTAVVTQELLVYLGAFARVDPELFTEMLRLRIGLIIEVMVAELARSMNCSGEDAGDYFMNLSPFEMKILLYHILSGKEFGTADSSTRMGSEKQLSILSIDLPKRVGIKQLSKTIRKLSSGAELPSHLLHISGRGTHHHTNFNLKPPPGPRKSKSDDEDEESGSEDDSSGRDNRLGQWIRRRCLDGALNRVPVDFYPNVWRVLEKCRGISIYRQFLPHAMVEEMTPRELKFSLCVEAALNRIQEPEYRQLVVEALMVLALVVENYPEQTLGDVLDIDSLVWEGYQSYLKDQVNLKGDSTICCARSAHDRISCGGAFGICRYFYDTAPSGRYGTMTYFSAALANMLSKLPHMTECVVS